MNLQSTTPNYQYEPRPTSLGCFQQRTQFLLQLPIEASERRVSWSEARRPGSHSSCHKQRCANDALEGKGISGLRKRNTSYNFRVENFHSDSF